MSDDFDLDALSSAWQSQTTQHTLDKTQFRKKVLFRKAILVATTLLEIVILFVVGWALFSSSGETTATHAKLFFGFAFITGVIIFVFMVKSRFKSIQLSNYTTLDWIANEKKVCNEALKRGKYANYLIFTMIFVLLGSFLYDYIWLNLVLADIASIYIFGAVWAVLGWLINRHQINKNLRYLDVLNKD
jgi:hypothetical protein